MKLLLQDYPNVHDASIALFTAALVSSTQYRLGDLVAFLNGTKAILTTRRCVKAFFKHRSCNRELADALRAPRRANQLLLVVGIPGRELLGLTTAESLSAALAGESRCRECATP